RRRPAGGNAGKGGAAPAFAWADGRRCCLDRGGSEGVRGPEETRHASLRSAPGEPARTNRRVIHATPPAVGPSRDREGARWDEAADPQLNVVAYTAPPRDALKAHEEEASHGICWHRSAQEGKPDLPAHRDGRGDRTPHPHRAPTVRGGVGRTAARPNPRRGLD